MNEYLKKSDNFPDEQKTKKAPVDNDKNIISDDNSNDWAEQAKQELEDFIESQGIYIRQ